MNDHALDALLAEFAPPPVPAGLAGRVVAAALALPQGPRPVTARRRRRAWLRRPMMIGGIALGLAVSGAVAATLAGVRLDRLPGVEAVLARIIGGEPQSESTPPPRSAAPEIAAPVAEPAPARERPGASPRVQEPPARAVPATGDETPPLAAPEAPPPVAEIIEPRRLDIPPPPVARQEEARPAAVAERPAPAPPADEQLRAQREQVERTERLRAARQAQIERMQRLRQSRERIRRLRRD